MTIVLLEIYLSSIHARNINIYGTITLITNCYSQSLKASFDTYERLPDWFNEQLYMREFGNYQIDPDMNPFYLEAD